MDSFRALVVDKEGEGSKVALTEWTPDQLMPGEVTIRVEYSSVNYKDGLATRVNGGVARVHPLIVGIDMAGEVVESANPSHKPGDKVIAHGYELGVSHHGGLAELARVPAAWVVPLPSGLSTKQAMAIGTAGFTAVMSVAALEFMGLKPEHGPVLVSGASGGVGSSAVAILAGRGFQVAASTGSAGAHDFLRRLGASEILDRAETTAESTRPLEKGRWAAGVETVGGASFAYMLRTMQQAGSIAISGNAGGIAVSTTVLPFILRGVNVLGIDSANLALDRRIELWKRAATDLRPPKLDETITHEISLDEAPAALETILKGGINGRTVVRLTAA